jgi:hypothetical protein
MPLAKKFAPALVENGRRRYENSDEPVRSIALDFDVDHSTMRRYIDRWGWTKRKTRPPHTLSPVMQLLEEARHVSADEKAVRRKRRPAPAKAAPTASPPKAAEAPAAAPSEPSIAGVNSTADAPDQAPLVERLLRAVERELSIVEAQRAHQGAAPPPVGEAERTARTIESLIRSLREVRRLSGDDETPAGFDDDDMPRDIDEFRLELARRIDAFVASRADAAAGGSDQPADGDPAGE